MNRIRSSVRRLLLAILIPVLAFLSLAAWSYSSPVGSSPDDNFHLAAIWCGLGDRDGLCEVSPDAVSADAREIPTPLLASGCFPFNPSETGACFDVAEPGLSETWRANIDGLYPPVYYAVMSLFASPNVEASVLAIRLFNSAFVVGVLTLVFYALPRRLRPVLVIESLVTAVPLGMFIAGSTNPSSWAILSGAIVWLSMYGALQTQGRRRWALLGLALLGTVIGAGSRADAAVYAVFGIGIAFVLGWRFTRRLLIPLVSAVVLALISVLFYVSSWQGSSIVGGLNEDRDPLTAAQHISNFLSAPSLWTGAQGGWGLGWLDTPLPATVSVLTGAVFWGAVFIGLRGATWRRGLAVALSIGAMWLIPVVLLGQSRAVVGELIQPRYIVPLMVIMVGVASLRVDAAVAWRGMRLLLAGAALAFANAIALHVNMQRYTTGLHKFSIDPGREGAWWWSVAPSTMVVWVGGSLAFAGVFVALWFVLQGTGGRDDAQRPLPSAAPDGADDVTEPGADGSADAVERAPVAAAQQLSDAGAPSAGTAAPRHVGSDAAASSAAAAPATASRDDA